MGPHRAEMTDFLQETLLLLRDILHRFIILVNGYSAFIYLHVTGTHCLWRVQFYVSSGVTDVTQ